MKMIRKVYLAQKRKESIRYLRHVGLAYVVAVVLAAVLKIWGKSEKKEEKAALNGKKIEKV